MWGFDTATLDDPRGVELLFERAGELSRRVTALPTFELDDDHRSPDGHDHHAGLAEAESDIEALAQLVEGETLPSLDALEDAAGEARELFTRATAELATLRDSLDERLSALHDALGALDAGVHDDDARLREAQSESSRALDEHGNALRGEQRDGARDVFERLSHALEEQCCGAVDSAFDAMNAQVDHTFGELHDEAERAGSGWSRAAEHLLADTASDISHTVLYELQEAVEDLLRHCIRAAVEEVAEHVLSTVSGAATTTALAPMIPELIAARATLRAINGLIEQLREWFD